MNLLKGGGSILFLLSNRGMTVKLTVISGSFREFANI
jgi:hypothetical protein